MARRAGSRGRCRIPAAPRWALILSLVNHSAPDIELLVGRIGKPHGIRGEVTIDVRTDEPELRFAPGAVLLAEPPRDSALKPGTLTVARTRTHQGTLLAVFEEFADRNAAEAARGVLLRVRVAADAAPEDPEEFYPHQLIGLRAENLEGEHIGEVTGLTHGAAQDLIGIKALDGRATLVPFVTPLVPEVDLAGGRIVVADRPGLVAPFPDTDEPDPEQQGGSK